MKKIIFLIIALSLHPIYAQNLSKNEVFDVLSKWEGKWKNSVVFEESVWVLDMQRNTNSKINSFQ